MTNAGGGTAALIVDADVLWRPPRATVTATARRQIVPKADRPTGSRYPPQPESATEGSKRYILPCPPPCLERKPLFVTHVLRHGSRCAQIADSGAA